MRGGGVGKEDVREDAQEESEDYRREGGGHDDGREEGRHDDGWREEDELDDGRRTGGEGRGGGRGGVNLDNIRYPKMFDVVCADFSVTAWARS